MLVPVILAGGSGTRLWPLSRQFYPKQLMALGGGATMLQNTLRRLSGLRDLQDPIVICNENHRFMVAEQLRADAVKADALVLEPVGRNTAPAVAVAALLARKKDPEAVLCVLPADHFIREAGAFRRALETGRIYAEQENLITFGVVPHTPETGYGYIKKGAPVEPGGKSPEHTEKAVWIDSFVEKPDLAVARNYLESGQYCWNSGMFMFKASRVLAEMKRFVPEIVAACQRAVAGGRHDLDFFRLDVSAFEQCPADSIDYAIMEKTNKGVMVPFEAGWNDLGSWEALWNVGDKDAQQNVLIGDVITHDVKGSYLRSDSRLIAAVGLENHIIVETADSVLICPRHRAQEVKYVVDYLKSEERQEALTHRTEYRPWGSCEILVSADRFQVNRLTVRPGEKLSLQKHFHRAEHWVLLAGEARVIKDDEVFLLAENQSVYFPPDTCHRLENKGDGPLEVIEIQTGKIISDSDIERLEDAYGR